MHKFTLIFFLIITACFSNNNNLIAQISEGGRPPSFIHKLNDSLVDKRAFKILNLKQAILEDSLIPGPLWAGRSIPVGLNMSNSGRWTYLTDGSRVWRLKLNAPGAKAVAVCYDDFYIPVGGKLFLYNALKTQVIGAYTYKNNPVKKLFSTEIIQGETVTLEYYEPKPSAVSTASVASLSISEIVYIYRTVPFVEQYSLLKSPQFGTSNACEVNVNCSEGTNWQKQKRGVAEIFLKNGTTWGWCSGDLINTTNNSGIPYLITADHCHSEGGKTASASDMLQWQFYFNYESATCSTPSSAPAYNTLTGCVYKASSPLSGGSDFCLVLLNNTPPKEYNPYYNGWNRTNTAPTSGAGIHHPEADIKKISTYTSSLSSGTWYDGSNLGASGAHWGGSYVKTTNGYGQTEPGSSGSPLFNQNYQQVGTLTGGDAASCSNGSGFLYGKIYYHWDKTGTASSQQLKPWLDPLGTNPSNINGFDPYLTIPPVASFSATPTTSCSGNIQFTDLSLNNPTSWEWDFGDGNKSTSQNPAYTYTTSGIFNVTLKTTNSFGSNSMTKDSYININLPEIPSTTSASRCGTGSVDLQASGSGILNWYDAQSGGNLINTGFTYSTPDLSSNTTYYVESEVSQPAKSVGLAAKTTSGSYYFGTNYDGKWALTFNVINPLKLVAVTVYANSTANRTIWLKNSSGVEIDSLVVNIASGQQTVNLNFDIPAGTGYLLGTNGQNNLWRDQNIAVFPYTIPDLISITGNNTTSPTNYYYFYNWQVQPASCFSSRTPVTATITTPVKTDVSILANPSGDICYGTPVTFTANIENGGDTPFYQWKINGVITGTNNSEFTSSTLNDGDIITCELTSSESCATVSPAISNNIIMSVFQAPSAPVLGINNVSQTIIEWSWKSVDGASGYKWNSINDYNTSTDNGLSTILTQTGLTDNTSYTIFIWAYNDCGHSNAASVTQTTLAPVKYKLTGKIVYDNTEATPLNNAKIVLKTPEGLHVDSSITGTKGIYNISNLLPGKYITEITTSESTAGINPLDALLVNRFYIGNLTFDDNLKKQAGDVDKNNKLTPVDALLINRKYIKAINSFIAGDWLFEKDTVNIKDKDDTLNIKGLNYGDVNASRYGKKRILDKPLNTKEIISTNINQIVELPVRVDRNTELSALGLVINYDENVLDIIDVISNNDNLVYKVTDNEIRIAWAGCSDIACNASVINLKPDETLITLKLRVKTTGNIDLILAGESVLADNYGLELSSDILYTPKLSVNMNTKAFNYNCHPNPFKDETTISYVLPEPENITIKLLDILGREIQTLVNTEQSAGNHQVIIDGTDKQPGIYFYSITTKDTRIIQRVVLVH